MLQQLVAALTAGGQQDKAQRLDPDWNIAVPEYSSETLSRERECEPSMLTMFPVQSGGRLNLR